MIPLSREQRDELIAKAQHRLTICRDLTDDAQADCEVIRELRDALRCAPEDEGWQAPRPETGAMQFGDDWKGLFIRGDNAFAFALAIKQALPFLEQSPLIQAQLRGLAGMFDSSNQHHGAEPQRARLLPPPLLRLERLAHEDEKGR